LPANDDQQVNPVAHGMHDGLLRVYSLLLAVTARKLAAKEYTCNILCG
jgi:hypothetical protein